MPDQINVGGHITDLCNTRQGYPMAEDTQNSDSQDPNVPDRSLVTRANIPGSVCVHLEACHLVLKYCLKYASRWVVDDKVWLKDSNGHHSIMMFITAKRNDAAAGWEYQLKDTNGVGYRNGTWVAQEELRDA